MSKEVIKELQLPKTGIKDNYKPIDVKPNNFEESINSNNKFEKYTSQTIRTSNNNPNNINESECIDSTINTFSNNLGQNQYQYNNSSHFSPNNTFKQNEILNMPFYKGFNNNKNHRINSAYEQQNVTNMNNQNVYNNYFYNHPGGGYYQHYGGQQDNNQ
jgi:hypothetical protein